MRMKNNKGITLIALVITIIVLLILAGVTINMVLGDDGIIAQAQDAKKAQQESEDKQAIKLATGEAATSEHLGVLTAGEVEAQSDIRFSTENPYNNSIREILKFGDKYLPIPKGMAWAYGTIDEGAVVVDKYGNEFVWVPVDEVKPSGTSVNYDDEYVWLVHNENDIKDQTVGEVSEVKKNDYNKMKTSVDIYGGVYVGRYETSWTGSRVASVPNVDAMNGYTEIDYVNDEDGDTVVDSYGANWATFYTEQKKLHESSSSVVSGMIYSSQWDAIMDWMHDVPNPDSEKEDKLYITDSTNMGHYFSDNPIKTGSNSAYAVKNIFDLAGNYSEWTQELYNNDKRVTRGGRCNQSSKSNNASSSSWEWSVAITSKISSRLQLYIK